VLELSANVYRLFNLWANLGTNNTAVDAIESDVFAPRIGTSGPFEGSNRSLSPNTPLEGFLGDSRNSTEHTRGLTL
jgi:hypothetical protein